MVVCGECGSERGMTMTEHRVKVDKYEFVTLVPRVTWIAVYHAGKPVGFESDRDDAIGLMMEQLDAARMVVQAARDAVDAPTLRRKEFLQEALALHDRLTSDREPPSAWCGVKSGEDGVGCVTTHGNLVELLAMARRWSDSGGQADGLSSRRDTEHERARRQRGLIIEVLSVCTCLLPSQIVGGEDGNARGYHATNCAAIPMIERLRSEGKWPYWEVR